MTSLAVCQPLINYYLAAAGRLFAVFAFGGWRATFSRFRLAVSVGAVRAVLFFSAFRRFFLCGLRRSGDFLPFALAFRACVLHVLRCLRFAAGGRFLFFCGVCLWRRAGGRAMRAVFFFASFAVLNLFAVGGRFYCFAAFLRFFLRFAAGGRLFIFCDVCVGVSGVRFARFAVFAFCGGRAFFTIQSPNLRATALLEKRCPRV